MRSVPKQISRLEALEGRRLLDGVIITPADGYDVHLVSDLENDTTPGFATSVDPVKPVPLPGGFRWFDGTASQDIIEHGGALDYIVVDGWNFWPRNSQGMALRDGDPSEANTRWFANWTATVSDTMCIDIENWQMDIRQGSKELVNQNITRFENIIRWIREEQPNLKIGIYSLFPFSDLYNTVQYDLYAERAVDPTTGWWFRNALPGASNRFALLQNTNAYLAGLASKVDYIYPALYTSSAEVDLWRRYAVDTVEEARRYGKPVIPFLMPTYHHAAASLNQDVIPAEFWQFQLDLMPQIADGAVIWTDPLAPTGVDEYWIQLAIDKAAETQAAARPLASSNTAGNDDDSTFSQQLIADVL